MSKIRPVAFPIAVRDKHDALGDGHVIDARFVDVAAMISVTPDNGLRNDGGLYYAAVPCDKGASYTIATDFYPMLERGVYQAQTLRVKRLSVYSTVRRHEQKDAVGVALEPVGGVLVRYGKKDHEEKEAVGVTLELVSGELVRLGAVEREEKEAVGVGLELLTGELVRILEKYTDKDAYKTNSLTVKAIKVGR